MHRRMYHHVMFLMISALLIPAAARAQQAGDAAPPPGTPTLARAVMCEEVKNLAPWNEAAVFSIGTQQVVCYSAFDPVPEETVIYHAWYRQDRLTTRIKLHLKTPRWAAFSRIRLRKADKGPWRVEISDREDKLIDVLRFSITD